VRVQVGGVCILIFGNLEGWELSTFEKNLGCAFGFDFFKYENNFFFEFYDQFYIFNPKLGKKYSQMANLGPEIS
jgi:hypothetical protein